MLRMLGAAQKREVKATQNLAVIVLFFMICWIPLYTINCTLAFCHTCTVDPTFMNCCIILSHLNSAGNPLLYAYNLKDFRSALKNYLCGIFGKGLSQLQIAKNRASMQSHMLNSIYNSNRARTLHSARSDVNLSQNCFGDSLKTKSKSVQLPLTPKLLSSAEQGAFRRERHMCRISEVPSTSEACSNQEGKINESFPVDEDNYLQLETKENNRIFAFPSDSSTALFLVEDNVLPAPRPYNRSFSALECGCSQREDFSRSSLQLGLKCASDVLLLNVQARSSSDESAALSDRSERKGWLKADR